MIENIHIIESHALQRLIQTGKKIFSASTVAVRPFPHIIAGFCGDDHFIPVRAEMFFQNLTEIAFCAAGLRPIVVCQIKMGDSIVKCGETHLFHIGINAGITEIVPQSERDCRKQETAFSAAVVFHGFISSV